jgi:predicted AlkP superfamily phosphohydrolase/phosphomutase
VFVSSRVLRDASLWQLLTAAGRQVAVLGLPMMYPPPSASGTVVSGFDTPSTAVAFTDPPELRDRILARFPDYAFVAVPDARDGNLEGEAAFTDFFDQVERTIEQRTRVALELLAARRWDVFMVHYQDSDALQHAAWRFIAEPARDPARWERIRAAYRRLDDRLGELIAAAPPDALVIVLSDHGFGSHLGRVFPNVLLRDWGYLSWRGQWWNGVRRKLRRRLVKLGLAQPEPKVAEAWRDRVREHDLAHALPLRWRRTRAYVALAEIYGLLFVNLHGRAPEGTVAPGAERDALVAELAARLQDVRDPRDGAAVFSEVMPGAAIFPEDPYGLRPDLVLVPRPGFSVHRELRPHVWIDYHGLVAGTHRPEGILLVAGDGIRHAPMEGEARLVDVAPTVLAVADVGVPEDMDGRPLLDLFAAPPVVQRVAPVLPPPPAPPATEGEEEQVVARLRALGYMG